MGYLTGATAVKGNRENHFTVLEIKYPQTHALSEDAQEGPVPGLSVSLEFPWLVVAYCQSSHSVLSMCDCVQIPPPFFIDIPIDISDKKGGHTTPGWP